MTGPTEEPLPDDPDALRNMVRNLRADIEKLKKKTFWAVETRQDIVKNAAVPLALILSLFTFWDTVVLRVLGKFTRSSEGA